MKAPRLSRRTAALTPSSTIEVARAAKALAATGADIVDFGLGEPDFDTPSFVAEAGIAAIRAGKTRYTDVGGAPSLRDAIAEKYQREQGARLARENVLVPAVAKQAVFNACQALFQEGDEVAIFAPYWVSFPEMVRLAGASPRIVSTDLASGWQPTASGLSQQAGPNTRGVIVNSPSNPTGAVIGEEELRRILEWCKEREAFLIFDETYDRFLYDERPHVSAVRFRESHGDRLIVTGSASKTYAMTGWRLGWAVGPAELLTAMASYQSHSTSNASSISQEAACAALTDVARSDASVQQMLAQYADRRAAMLEGFAALPEASCVPPEGAFYIFARLDALYAKKGVSGSVELCRSLLEKAHVAAVPGDAFGDDSCVRFSFATPLPRIQEGMRRIREWAKE